MNKYYIYVHYRESDGLPFYVGKGSGNRAWDFQSKGRNLYWQRVKNKHGIKVEIIFDGLTEEEAFQCERDAILEFNYIGYPLTNLTSGGEGCSGLIFSDQQRLNISNGLKEKRYSHLDRVKREVKRPSAYGNNNHNADLTLYTFVRLSDNFEITCTRHDLCSKYDVNRESINKLFCLTNSRKSAAGWKLKGKQ